MEKSYYLGALEKTYYKMGVWRRREDVLSWGDVKTYFQLGVWSGKSFLERGGWSKSLGHGASRSSRYKTFGAAQTQREFLGRVVAGKIVCSCKNAFWHLLFRVFFSG